MDKKVLTAYFSYEGHTRKIAEKICRITGGDLFEIRPAQAYCTDYNKTERQARQEVKDGFRPVLAQKPQDMTQYDIVFVGTPKWLWRSELFVVFGTQFEYDELPRPHVV